MERPDDYGIELDKALDKSATYAFGETKGFLNYKPQYLNDNKTIQHKLLFDDINKYLSEKGYEDVPTFDPLDSKFNKGQYRPTTFEVGDGSVSSRTFTYYRDLLEKQGATLGRFPSLTEAHKKRIIDQEAIGLASLQTYIMDSLPDNLSVEDKEVVNQFQDAYLSQILLPAIEDGMKQYADTHNRHTTSKYFRQGIARFFGSASKTLGSAWEDLTPFGDGEDGKNLLTDISDMLNDYANQPEMYGTGMFALSDAEVKAEYGSAVDIPFTDVDVPTLKENYLFHKIAETVAQNVQSIATLVGSLRGARGGRGGNRFIGAAKGGLKYGAPGFLVETGHFQSEFEENYYGMREKAKLLKRAMDPDEFAEEFGIQIDEGEEGAIYITADKLTDRDITRLSSAIAREYGLYATAMEIGSSIAYGLGTAVLQTGTGLVTSKYLKSKAGQQAMANEWWAKKLGKKLVGQTGYIATNATQEGITERMQEALNIHMAENGGVLLSREARIGNYGKMTEAQKRERLSSATFGGIAMGGAFETARGSFNLLRQGIRNEPRAQFDESVQEDRDSYDGLVNQIKADIEKATEKNKPFTNMVDQAVILRSIKDGNMQYSYNRIMDTMNEYQSVLNVYPDGVDEDIINVFAELRGLDGTLTNKKKLLNVLGNTSKTLLNKLNIDDSDLEKLDFTTGEIKAIFPNYVDKRKPKPKSKTNYTSKANIPTKNNNKINQSSIAIDNDIQKVSDSLNKMLQIKKMTTKQKEIYNGLKKRLEDLKQQRDNREKVQSNQTKISDDKFIKPQTERDPFVINRVNIESLGDHQLKKIMQGLPNNDKSDNLNYSFRVLGVSQSVNPINNKKEKVYNVTLSPDGQKLFGIKKNNVYQIHESSIRIALTDKNKRYKIEEGVDAPITKNPVATTLKEPQPQGLRPTISNKKNNLKEVLQFIETNSDENKGVAGLLKKVVGNVPIEFDGALKYQGVFNPSTNDIKISPKGKDDSLLERVVLHEAVHAATSNNINAYLGGRLKKNTKAYKSVAQLDKIFTTLKDGLTKDDKQSLANLEKLYAEIKGGKVSKDDVTDLQKALRDEFYGFSNLNEFTAELLTNKTFQNKLKNIKYKKTNKTLFDKFKEIIAKVFGVEKSDTALYNSLAVAMEAIDAPQQKSPVAPSPKTLHPTKSLGRIGGNKKTLTRTVKGLIEGKGNEGKPVRTPEDLYEYFNIEKRFKAIDKKTDGFIAKLPKNEFYEESKKNYEDYRNERKQEMINRLQFMEETLLANVPKSQKTAKEARETVDEYLAPQQRVQFPPAKSINEAVAIVDGIEVKLTKAEKKKLLAIGKDKGSMSTGKQAKAEVELLSLGRSLIKKHGKKLANEKEASAQAIAQKEAFDKKLPKMKLARLRDIAKERGVKGYSNLQKGLLIQIIKGLPPSPTVEEVFDFGDKKGTGPQSALQRLAKTDLGKEVITEDVITTSAQNVVDELASKVGDGEIDEKVSVDQFKRKNDDRDYSIFEGLGLNKGKLQRNDQVRANNAFESIWLELQDKYDIDEMFWSNWRGMMQSKLKGTIFHSHFKQWADKYQTGLGGAKDDIGVNEEQTFHLFDPKELKNDEFFSSHNIKRLIDAGNWVEETVRQGLSVNENKLEASTNTNNTGKIENGFFRLIDLIPSTKQNMAIGDAIKKSKGFDEFISTVSSDKFVRENGLFLAGNQRIRDFLENDPDGIVRMKMLRFYLSGLDINRTETNRGFSHKGAIRTLFGIYTGNVTNDKDPEYKIRFMNHRNRVINRYNTPNKMRSRAIERTGLFDPQDLMYLSLNDLYRWVPNENPDSKYKVKTAKQPRMYMGPDNIETLSRSLIKKGMVPLMIRGDSSLIPVVRIDEATSMKAYAPDKYWVEEISDYTQEEMVEFSSWLNDYFPEKMDDEMLNRLTGYKGKAGMNRLYAQAIARHEAYKKMYGDKYWKYMNGHKMLTRSKLVFSQGTVNPEMPKQTAVVFDPKIELEKNSKARIVHHKKDGSEQEVPLVVFAGGKWRYKLDGKLLTSESVHRDVYPKYLGTNPKATRAKTAMYQRGETGAIAFKHQEMSFHTRPDVSYSEIYDGDGTLVATIKRDSRGYNQIYKEGDNAGEISYLGTPDENKFATGEYADEQTRKTKFNEPIVLNPESINLIMYPRDHDKSYGKMMIQLMNYHSDPQMQKAVMQMFDEQDVRKKFTPTALLEKFKDIMSDSNKLSDYMQKWVNVEIDNLPVAFAQNASLKAGFHPTQSGMNKNVIKNSILEGIKDFNTYGSTLDINMDVFGDVKRDEAIIPYDHKIANNIFAIYRSRFGGRGPVDIDDINNWIKTLDRPIEVLVIRSPVPGKFKYAVVNVKELQNIGDTVVLNDDVISNDLEADGDGDKVTVVMSQGANKKVIKLLKQRHQTPPVLTMEKGTSNLNIADLNQLNLLTSSMIAGQGAIGQIASIARTTGILKTWFKSLTIKEPGKEPVTIVMRDLDNEMITDIRGDDAVKGTVADHYYAYLQAAFDHGQFLLLDKWNYHRDVLYEMAFKYENESGEPISYSFGKQRDKTISGPGIIDMNHMQAIVETLLIPTAKVGQMLNGFQNGKAMTLADEIEASRDYMDFVNQRKNLKGELEILMRQDEVPTVMSYEIKGKNTINSIHEKMATRFATYIDENAIDIGKFDLDGEVSRNINIKVMRSMIDDLIEQGRIMSIIDEGYTEEQFEKLSAEEKTAVSRKANEKTLVAHKGANNFKSEIMANYNKMQNRNKQDLEDSNELAFDVNKWSFDPVMRNIYEKWMEITDSYTDSQRFQFTLKYLFDTANPVLGYRQRDVRLIPPATRLGPSLMDANLLQDYYEAYNKELANYDENTKKENPWMEELIDQIKYEWQRSGCIG